MLSTDTQRAGTLPSGYTPSLSTPLATFRNVLSVCAQELPPYVACWLCRIRASEAREIYVQQSAVAGSQAVWGRVERGSQRERYREGARVKGEVSAVGKGR